MASTRSTDVDERALQHVLDNVLKHEYFALIFDAIGVLTTDDFLMVDPKDLRDQYCMRDADKIKLNAMQIGMVKKVQSWYYNQTHRTSAIWFTLNQESLADFVRQGPASKTKETRPKTDVGPKMLEGVKRSVQDYPKLRDDKMWMSWHRSFVAVAATHALTDVIDPNYTPTKEEERDFEAKNTFLFSVFTNVLITNKAKVCLRPYEGDRNGQLVYCALVSSYSDGTAATLSAESLEMVIRNMKLDTTWNKSVETFLHMWSTRLHDLESVRDGLISDLDKRRWLVNSVKTHSHMSQAINTALSVEQYSQRITLGSKMSWEQFFNLLLEQALIYDSTHPPGKRQLKANSQQQSRNGNNNNNRNNQRRNPRRTYPNYISPDKWHKMSREEKQKIIDQRKNRQQQNNQTLSQPGTAPTSDSTQGDTQIPHAVCDTF